MDKTNPEDLMGMPDFSRFHEVNPRHTHLLCRDCCVKFQPPNNGGVGAGMCEYCYNDAPALYEVEWSAGVYNIRYNVGELLQLMNFDEVVATSIQKFEFWRQFRANVCEIGGGLIGGKECWVDGHCLCEGHLWLHDAVKEALNGMESVIKEIDEQEIKYLLTEGSDGRKDT